MYYTFISAENKNPKETESPPNFPKGPTEGAKNPPIVRNIDNVKEQSVHTPYPDQGIILKSLNYIQMDVISSLLFKEDSARDKVIYEKHHQPNIKRDTAVLTEALHEIEHNFRSLF